MLAWVMNLKFRAGVVGVTLTHHGTLKIYNGTAWTIGPSFYTLS